MKTKQLLRAISLFVLMVSFLPAQTASALDSTLPPADMFQLPWDQGIAWMAIDGLDNGTKRPMDSSHQFTVGGAIDFAPRKDMQVGENTSTFWVTADAAGTVIEKSFCHLKIKHDNGWISEYQFLANVLVKAGDVVYRNQRLAIIANGSTQKFCPGSKDINIPHLHFMLRPTLRDVTFAGWKINYLPQFNRTNFVKSSETRTLFQLLSNTLDLQIVARGPLAWDTVSSGSVDSFRYERWSFALNETTKFTLTGTPVTSGLTPLLVLLDANGNEIARGANTLTSTQPAGSYFVQVQPQAGSGFYKIVLHKEDLPLPTGAYVSTVVDPTNVNVGETSAATVSLGNLPAEGYTSTEFTCTYNAALVEVSNIAVASLFGADPAVAISGPQNGTFIVAVAGSNGNKAAAGGTAFTFSAKGLAAGQSPVGCTARVSKGDSLLTPIESVGATLTVGAVTVPTVTPTLAPVETATPTTTPTQTEPVMPTDSPTPTAQGAICDKAEFVEDVAIPPGTVLLPGATTSRIWRIRNAGSCTWTSGYGWTFVSGDLMQATVSNTFSGDILPGQTADMYVQFSAPFTSGHYQSLWKLFNASGVQFGTGASASDPLVLDIVTSGPTVTATATQDTPVPWEWSTFLNSKYGFQFLYPRGGQLLSGSTDNYARINLPFTAGTNLSEKYLEVVVAEAMPCHSPLAASSLLETSETVSIAGLSFLKETGQDGTAGHINKWTAYSTMRNGVCVSLDFVLRAANPGVFTTPPPFYDETLESNIFREIVQTYLWLTPAPTATLTLSPIPDGSPTPTTTPIAPVGTVEGKVLAGKTVTVSLLNADNSAASSGTLNPDGLFNFTVPVGTYTVVASVPGFLSARTTVTLELGTIDTLPTITLLAGDIDNNNVIDQFDAMTIGMSYNTVLPAAADLNSDGIINVLDLELLAGNYRATGPVAWQ